MSIKSANLKALLAAAFPQLAQDNKWSLVFFSDL